MAPGQDGISPNEAKLSSTESREFWALWKENSTSLLDLCLVLLKGNQSEAADLHHAAMLKAYDAWAKKKDSLKNPGGWLYQITYNLCRDRYRRENRHPEEGLNDRQSFQGRQDGPSVTESPEDSLLRREMYQNLREAIDRLPERIRQPSLLRWVQNMPYREIAKQLNLSNTNVRKRVQEGRGMIRESLHSYLEKGGGEEFSLYGGPQEVEAVKKILENRSGELEFGSGWLEPVQARDGRDYSRTLLLSLNKKPSRLDQRKKSLTTYISNFPSGWKKRVELARILLLQGHMEESLHHLTLVLEKQGQNFESRLYCLLILDALGRKEEGLKICREALPHVRSDSARLYFHAWTEYFKGHYRTAAEFFEKAAATDTGVAEYGRQIVRCLALSGEEAGIELYCHRSWIEGERDPYLLYAWFCRAWKCGRLAEAGRLSGLFSRNFPRQVPGIWMEGLMQLHSPSPKALKEVKKTLKRLQKVDSASAFSNDLQVRLLHKEGRRTELIHLLKQNLKQQPFNREMLLLNLKWNYRLGFAEGCKQALETVITHFPDDPELLEYSLLNLACLAPADLYPWEHLVHTHHAGHSRILLRLAAAMQDSGQPKDALALAKATLEEHGDLPENYSLFADILTISGAKNEAIKALKKGWRLLQADSDPLLSVRIAYQRARLYRDAGKAASARNWYGELSKGLQRLEGIFPELVEFYQNFLQQVSKGEGLTPGTKPKLFKSGGVYFPLR